MSANIDRIAKLTSELAVEKKLRKEERRGGILALADLETEREAHKRTQADLTEQVAAKHSALNERDAATNVNAQLQERRGQLAKDVERLEDTLLKTRNQGARYRDEIAQLKVERDEALETARATERLYHERGCTDTRREQELHTTTKALLERVIRVLRQGHKYLVHSGCSNTDPKTACPVTNQIMTPASLCDEVRAILAVTENKGLSCVPCPKCGKASRLNNTIPIFICDFCRHSFQHVKE